MNAELTHGSNRLVRVKDISLRFGGVHALTGVSFDILAHEVCSIIGPNGAGKSSMLNVLNGVYRPQEGTITLNGVEKTMVSAGSSQRGDCPYVSEHRAFQGHDRFRKHSDGKMLDEQSVCSISGISSCKKSSRG